MQLELAKCSCKYDRDISEQTNYGFVISYVSDKGRKQLFPFARILAGKLQPVNFEGREIRDIDFFQHGFIFISFLFLLVPFIFEFYLSN